MKRLRFLQNLAAGVGIAAIAPSVFAESGKVAQVPELILSTPLGLNMSQIKVAAHWNDDKVTQIVAAGDFAMGKTYIATMLLVEDASRYPGTNYFIAKGRNLIGPQLSVKEVLENVGLHAQYNDVDEYFEFDNGSRIFLIKCFKMESDPEYDRFGSIQMTRGVIDGAHEVDEDAISALRSTLGRWKNREYNLVPKLLITSRPTTTHWTVYQDFYCSYKKGTLTESRAFIPFMMNEENGLKLDHIKELKKQLSARDYNRAVFGIWES